MNFKKRKPLIILIAGRAGSGKGTIAKYLEKEYKSHNKKVINSPYTKYLKNYIEEITNEPITETNKPKVRDLLQQISSKLIKEQLKKQDFFIRRQIEDLDIYSYFADVILVSDVRFPREIEEIKDKFSNVISIGVTRENYTSDLTISQQQDITETALNNYHNYDFEIKNTNKTELENVVKKIIQQIEKKKV